MSDEILNDVKELNGALPKETLKEVLTDMTGEEVEGRLTCDELFAKVEPYRDVPALGNKKYEEIRKDYNDCDSIWDKLQTKISGLKGIMEELENIMNASVGGIKQELFTQHYEVVRDLSHCMGQEAALLLRKASSAVIFLQEIERLNSKALN